MDADQNNRGLYGQKLTSTGTRLWPTTGKIFIEISSTNVYPLAARNSPADVVLFYEEYTDAVNGHLKAMRIDGNGGYIWSPSIKTICNVTSEKVHTVTNDFANNQWILSWEDNRNSDRDIYAQNIQLDGSLGPAQIGTITGTVTLSGGAGDVTQVLVTAGDVTVNPNTEAYYIMEITAGTWDVSASLAGFYTQVIQIVVVEMAQTTGNVNFELEIVRGDLVCKATDTYSNVLNSVEISVTGPDSTYAGTIVNDSLLFELATYGNYSGMAFMPGEDPANNNSRVFFLVLPDIPCLHFHPSCL
jgi:hypothetical protein